jgi:CTP:molybdopterin cytidylyltransferase MocA
MRATVEHGLNWIEDKYRPGPEDLWLLAPADHPTLNADVVRQLHDSLRSTGRSIGIPVHAGRRGHPTVLAWRHVAKIRALAPNQGINSYLRAHAGDVHEMPVADPNVLADLDTPGDYERLLASFNHD